MTLLIEFVSAFFVLYALLYLLHKENLPEEALFLSGIYSGYLYLFSRTHEFLTLTITFIFIIILVKIIVKYTYAEAILFVIGLSILWYLTHVFI